ncbi:MAG: hypothetical protein M1371_00155 [Actinobacteria bacterium]|nr:hypothetical protein [Actinomycetota bacterium]
MAIFSIAVILFTIFFTPIFSVKVDSRFDFMRKEAVLAVKFNPPDAAGYYFVSYGVRYSNKTASFPGRVGIYLISPQNEITWSSFAYADEKISYHRLYFINKLARSSSVGGDNEGSFTLFLPGSENLVPYLSSISIYRRVFTPFEIKLFYFLSRFLGMDYAAFPQWLSRPDGWVLSLIGISITALPLFILFAWLLGRGVIRSRMVESIFRGVIVYGLLIFLVMNSAHFFKDLSRLRMSAAVTLKNNENSIEMFSNNLPYASVNSFFKWCDLDIEKSSDVVMLMRGNSQYLQARAAYFLYPRKVAFVDLDELDYADTARYYFDHGYDAAISFEEINEGAFGLNRVNSYRMSSGFIYEVGDAD